jgi:hypothetical protein
VAGRKDEAVTIQPLRRVRIVAHRRAEQHRADFRAAEGQTEVAGIAGMYGIHGESTSFIGGLGEGIRIHKRIGVSCKRSAGAGKP